MEINAREILAEIIMYQILTISVMFVCLSFSRKGLQKML